MKKVLSLLVCLALCLSVFSGCHGKIQRTAFTPPETFDASKTYEISFWAKNDTNLTQVGIYKQAISDFEALYPNIKVNLRLYTDYGKIYNDVITNLSTDTTPNVCITYPDHIATYRTGTNAVVPLDSLMTHEKYGLGGSALLYDGPTQIVEKFLSECYLDGSHYALPYMRSTEACYVNKDFVEKLGFTLPQTLTWDFVWQVSNAATEKNPDGSFQLNGQQVLLPFIYKSTDNLMITYLKQAGAGYSSSLGQIHLFNDTTRNFLLTVGENTATGAFTTFKQTGYPANFLNAGQCIFAIDSTAGATWMGSNAPLMDIPEDKIQSFETVVYPIPQLDPENPRMISQGPSLCIFNKQDPQEVLASWLFTQFLLTNDVQIAYAQTEGYVPVTADAQESQTYQTYLNDTSGDTLHYDIKLKATKLLLENTENTFTTPVFNGSTALRSAAGHLVESTVLTALRKQSVDRAYLDTLFADTQSLYRLDTLEASGGKTQLSPIPPAGWALIGTLAAAWVAMGAALLLQKRKRSR